MQRPKVYVLPSFLGATSANQVLPEYNLKVISELTHFVVENEKSARRFIKNILPEKSQAALHIEILNKHTDDAAISGLLSPLLDGKSIGIISEAGMPGIADPGARLVWAAHQKNFQVVPLIGPSSIFLALAASGFNGQTFTFNGYLPIEKRERKQALLHLENKSRQLGSAEIFMETPYRNNKFLEDILQTLSSSTRLCVACDITLSTEFIYSDTVLQWKKKKVDLHKRPAIFLLQA